MSNFSQPVDKIPASQTVTTQDIVSATTTGYNSQNIITGTPTAGSAASFPTGSLDSANVQVSGTWTGTLVSEISVDGGTTWYTRAIHQSGTPYMTSTFTANFEGLLNIDGTTNYRLRATAAFTGTATVKVVFSSSVSSVYLANNPKIQDGAGTNNTATIKAASTAPLATDPALVVSISPNSPGSTVTQGPAGSAAWKVDGSAVTQPVSGTFFQTTQPVSASALPLPTGAATDATLATMSAKIPALGQATAANSQPVALASDQVVVKVTGQSAQTATVSNILTAASGSAATDVSQFRSFMIQVNSTGTAGTYIFEGSVDNVTFVALPVFNITALTPTQLNTAQTATNATIFYTGATQFPFIRLRIATAITGGSIQAFSAFSFNPYVALSTIVAQGSGGNLQGNVTTVLASAAASDATANPTTTGLRAFDQLFNNSTWDRYYNNYNTTTGDTGAKTTTFNGSTQTNFNARGATITAVIPTVSGTTPTLVIKLQYSPDAGTTWMDLGVATASIVSSGNYSLQVYPGITTTANLQFSSILPRTWRAVYTIGGTTPSFTLTAVYVNYQL